MNRGGSCACKVHTLKIIKERKARYRTRSLLKGIDIQVCTGKEWFKQEGMSRSFPKSQGEEQQKQNLEGGTYNVHGSMKLVSG